MELRARYPEDRAEGRNWALTIFSILGGLLIGTGVITIFATNWDELGRGARTVVALLPMLVAQALAVHIYRRRLLDSLAWREGVATFWVVALGAALSLIWQTYHLPSEWTLFFLLWALLSLPVVYLLDSLAAVFLYLLTASVWSLSTIELFGSSVNTHFYWVLLAAAVPMALMRRKTDADSASSALAFWLLAAACWVGTGASLASLARDDGDGVVLVIALTASAFVAISCAAFRPVSRAAKDPFGLLGGLCIFGMALILSFDSPGGGLFDMAAGMGIFSGIVILIWLGFSALVIRGGAWTPVDILLIAFPLLVFVDQLLSLVMGGGDLLAILYNGYLIALGVLLIRDGARRSSLSRANAGLVVVAILLLVRLFDSDISFTLKGILFILVGVGFLAGNIAIVGRRRRALAAAPSPTIPPAS